MKSRAEASSTDSVRLERDPFSVVRSFERDVLQPLTDDGFRPVTLTWLAYGSRRFPLLLVTHPQVPDPACPWVLVSGGVHGDEPAGVYAAVEFLLREVRLLADRTNFAVLPCVNPSGFEADTLETMSGANLNRLFNRDSTQPEVRGIEHWLSELDVRFRMTFDLHEVVPHYRGEGFVETDNPRSCYLYETQKDLSRRIGRRLIDALPPWAEVCRWPEIYLDRNSDGVIYYPEAQKNAVYGEQTTLDGYLNGRFTSHSFTTETPTIWPLERRIEVQRLWLRTACESLRNAE